MNASRLFAAALLLWIIVTLIYLAIERRGIALTIVPIAIALWYAAHASRVKQSTQLVLPVLLLPGALMCFVGFMQALGYGRMANEAIASLAGLRAAYFAFGLALHFAAYFLLANESRASDHVGGERATRI
ncbi:MAG: hypothetical protein ACRDAM_13535 [Casimicrobium sp.]